MVWDRLTQLCRRVCRFCGDNLKHVCLGHRFPDRHHGTPTLSFTAVQSILSKCFQLESLVLLGLTLTAEDMEYLAVHCRQLKELKFERVKGLSVSSLRAVLDDVPHLEVFGVEACPDLTFKVVAETLLDLQNHGLETLKTVILTDVEGYTTEGARSLARRLSDGQNHSGV